jgi:hypothetical protein
LFHLVIQEGREAITNASRLRKLPKLSNGAVSNQLTDAGREEDVLEVTVNLCHRVEGVLSLFSSRPNCDPPTPSPAGKRVSPFGWGGGGRYSLACGRGSGVVPFPRGDGHRGTLGINALCDLFSRCVTEGMHCTLYTPH